MPNRTNPGPVCVVGAGIIGVSAAYHLLRAGARDLTVVDAGAPLSGTTPVGAGFVAPFSADHNRRGHPALLPMEYYGLGFYRRLHESGHDIGYRANGNLVLATTQPTLDAARNGILAHPRAARGTRELSAPEVAEISGGVIDPDRVQGAVYMPEGIQVTTAQAVQAVTAEIEEMGGRFQYHTRVERVALADGRVTGVETDAGLLPARTVVLACGAWTNTLLAGAGYELPLIPMVGTRIVTEDRGLPPTMPTVQCRDTPMFWLRALRGGYSWGVVGGYRPVSQLRARGVAVGMGRPEVPALVEAMLRQRAELEKIFPSLSGARTEETIQGMPTYTADGILYAGRVPDRTGLWALAGDNEAGVTRGPAMGRLAADLVFGTEPVTDPAPFRLDRIPPGTYPDEASLLRAMEGDRIAAATS